MFWASRVEFLCVKGFSCWSHLQDRLHTFMDLPVIEKTVVINIPEGMHLRPAQLFAQLAQSFESEIKVARDSLIVDAKSIMHVMTLDARQGTELTLQAHGSDAEQALKAIAHLVDHDFETDETLSQGSTS
jgi:phosphotransferase system HPr (HPr) family protein